MRLQRCNRQDLLPITVFSLFDTVHIVAIDARGRRGIRNTVRRADCEIGKWRSHHSNSTLITGPTATGDGVIVLCVHRDPCPVTPRREAGGTDRNSGCEDQ